MNNRGFAPIAVIVLVVIAVGVMGYFLIANKSTTLPSQTSTNQTQTTNPHPTSVEPTSASIPANWKTYRSQQHQFEFMYPNELFLETNSSGLPCVQSTPNFSETEVQQSNVPPVRICFGATSDINLLVKITDWPSKRTYANLNEFITEVRSAKTTSPLRVTEEIKLDGEKAYQLSVGSDESWRGIFTEKEGRVYTVSFYESFKDYSDKNLTTVDRSILSSFKFSK